ncbi:hypothetical protein QCA50_000689 [Cerrena zonata]|uniref:RING-type domain-containing protein n=1 Tax=Cerrena zonata TaxID=2478898 RepID=A0AAW0GYD5_9APHY
MADDDQFIPMTTLERIAQVIHRLPILTKEEVPMEDSCPICLMALSSIVEGSIQNEGSLEMCGRDVQLSGITKLEGCGHVFCRVDLIEWIRGRHGTCPACRHTFLDVKPLSESEYESSDGDYIPGEDDEEEEEEEEDGFLDTDGFTDYEDEFDIEMEDPMHSTYGPMSTGASAGRPGFFSMVPSGSVHGSEDDVDLWGGLEDADGEVLRVGSVREVDLDWDGEEWVDEEEEENLGLSDGSESLSEGDLSMALVERPDPEEGADGVPDAAIVYGVDSQSSLPEASGSQTRPTQK